MRIDRILIFTFTFLVFSNIVNYMSIANITSITTVHLFLLIVIFTFLMIIKKTDFSFINMKLNWWIIFYLSVILLWYILPHNDFSPEELRRKILSIAAIFTFMIFIFYDDKNTSTVRQAVLFTTLLSAFNNIYEFINPYTFFPMGSNIGVAGRSAGLYITPTISGGAIVLGTLLSTTYIKKSYRIWYMLFSFVGVFTTFSRSAIIGFVIVYLYMTIKKQLDFKYLVFIPILLTVVLSFSLPFLTQYVNKTYERDANNIINRSMWFLDPAGHKDYSQWERQEVAEKAFNMFSDHPFYGAGLGSTLHWDYEVSTHNIYLSNMAEIGFLGIFIYPLLIYSIVKQARAETTKIAGIFAIFTIFIGFFSHNILDEFYFLFAFSLMANMSYKSMEKYKNA